MEKVTLNIEGMDCTNCALGIQRFLERKGIDAPHVSFTNAEAYFQLKNTEELPKIIAGIEKLGYQVNENTTDTPNQPSFTLQHKFILSAIFTLPLLLHMFIDWHWLHHPYVQLCLALPVFFIGIIHFGKSAYFSLKAGVANMDVLIILGATAAFGYSLYGTWMELGSDFLFYETAASIITIVLLGNLIEHRAVLKTTSSVDALVKLQHTVAKRLQVVNGKEQTESITANQIKENDVLLVNTGDVIPTDGIIVQGAGSLNEAMISGESVPVEKQLGDKVIGGTLLTTGSITVRATKVGTETLLSQIIQMVKEAQQKKPAIQQLADRVSSIFVPSVFAIALLTFSLSYFLFNISFQAALIHSIAVMVIACPCAMGLAVPTAVVVGIGKAARQGVLIKGADTLERLKKTKVVVFDKTGTLTTGHFQIQHIETFGIDLKEIQQLLVALERHSSHPIATSILKELQTVAAATLQAVREIKGLGMEGQDTVGNHYQLGSAKLLHQAELGHMIDEQANLYLLKNRQLVARIYLTDQPKPYAQELIAYFKEKGIRTVLLSGDSIYRTKALAETLQIDQFFAEKTPEEKLQIVTKLTQEESTAMVGDGVNDAPALAKATVGISLSNATQVAIEAAQIILLKGELKNLQNAFMVGEKTIKVIKQNLFWAFFYNVLAIPFAAVGLLTPLIASLTMAFSDIVVIFNSLRLKIIK